MESPSSSSPVKPCTPRPALPPLDRPSTSRRTMTRVDMRPVDSTEPSWGSIRAKTLVTDASAIDIIGRDKWRQYRGMPPSLKTHFASAPATSTPRATVGRTQAPITRPTATRRQPAPHHAGISFYKAAHQGLMNEEIVERGQKSQCTACGELPFGDGKPNHRWFNCPGLPPRPPRQVPAGSAVPQSARTRNQQQAGPAPGRTSNVKMPLSSTVHPVMVPIYASSSFVPQVLPSSARAPRDTPPHLAAVLNVTNAMRKTPMTGMNSHGSNRVSLAVPPPGQETKLDSQVPIQDPGLWNTTNARKRSQPSVPCGANGHHLHASPTRRTVSSTERSQQNINGRHSRRMEVINHQAENMAILRVQVEHETHRFSPGPAAVTAQVRKHTRHIGKSYDSAHDCLPQHHQGPSGQAQTRPLADAPRPVTFVEFQKPSIREDTRRNGTTIAHEEQPQREKRRVLGCPDSDGKDQLTRHLQLPSVEYTERSNKIKVQLGQGSESGRTTVGGVRVSVNASRMAENEGQLRNSRGVVQSTDEFPALVRVRATQGNLKREAIRGAGQSAACTSKNTPTDAITRGTVAGFFAWFENAQQGPGGTTTTAWRTANIVNARNAIHGEAIHLLSIKGMSRREWKAIGVHSGIGAEISRTVEEYLTLF